MCVAIRRRRTPEQGLCDDHKELGYSSAAQLHAAAQRDDALARRRRGQPVRRQRRGDTLDAAWFAAIPSAGRRATRIPPYEQLLAATEVGVVYLNVSHVSGGAGTIPVLVSEDYGATWKPTPTLPGVPSRCYKRGQRWRCTTERWSSRLVTVGAR